MPQWWHTQQPWAFVQADLNVCAARDLRVLSAVDSGRHQENLGRWGKAVFMYLADGKLEAVKSASQAER